jgi:hypothetical protein
VAPETYGYSARSPGDRETVFDGTSHESYEISGQLCANDQAQQRRGTGELEVPETIYPRRLLQRLIRPLLALAALIRNLWLDQ